jgi:hypothetical protein
MRSPRPFVNIDAARRVHVSMRDRQMWIERGARVGLIASSRSIEINSSPFSVLQIISSTLLRSLPFALGLRRRHRRATRASRHPTTTRAGTNQSHDQQYQPQAAFLRSEDCVSDTDGSTKAEAHFAVVGGADASVPDRTDQSAQRRLCGVRADSSRKIVLYSSCWAAGVLRSPRQTMKFLLKAPMNSII